MPNANQTIDEFLKESKGISDKDFLRFSEWWYSSEPFVDMEDAFSDVVYQEEVQKSLKVVGISADGGVANIRAITMGKYEYREIQGSGPTLARAMVSAVYEFWSKFIDG